MRIAVETTPLSRAAGGRGLGRYTSAVLDGVGLLGWPVVAIDLGPREGRGAELLDLIDRRRSLKSEQFDVFHATNPFVSSIRPGGRFVASILDVIPLDLAEYSQTGVKTRFFYRLAAHADCILTLSRFSAERISDRLDVAPGSIVIAPLPPAQAFEPLNEASIEERLHGFGLPGRYVATLVDLRTPDPRKRVEWIPRIAKVLQEGGLKLVAIGAGTERWNGTGGLIGLGRVSDPVAAAVFAGASAFVNTSAYEGQGMPMLEAMACGTSVVSMSNSAVPEIVGDSGILIEEAAAGEEAEPEGPRRLAEACLALIGDAALNERSSRAGVRAASRFSRKRFASGLKMAYEAA